VSFFEGTIERAAALAIFMPMVAGMAGNAGLQTLTLIVRSIALREIAPGDGLRVLAHEGVVAIINGLAIGLFVGIVASIWQGNAWMGLIVAVALLANIANAVTSGVVVPMTLRRLNLDPALSSGVIVMLADFVGFLVFLGLGTLLVTKLE
jgi:magnesium transporter